METLIKADIFFFIASAAIIVIAGLLITVLVYFIRIIKDVKHISKEVADETDAITKDISHLRTSIRAKGGVLASFSKLLHNLKGHKKRRTNIKHNND